MIKGRAQKNISGWLLFILGLAAIAGSVGLFLTSCSTAEFMFENPSTLLDEVSVAITGLAFAGIGRLLTLYRPENSIGWLIAILGICSPLASGLDAYNPCVLNASSSLHFSGLNAWLLMILSTVLILIQFTLLPALFPTGTFVSRSWKLAIWTAAAIFIFLTILALIAPGPMTMNGIVGEIFYDNPFGLPLPWLRNLESFLFYAIPFSAILASVIGIAAFIIRFRRSADDERQQLKWIAYFLSTVVAIHLIGFELVGGIFHPAIFEHWSYSLILTLSFSGFPIVIGLAIFKYRLYDIDLIIRRTLVYSILTITLALIYFGNVILLQRLVEGVSDQKSPISIVVSTLLIAVLFTPLRRRVQDAIDRRFYRRKYDAAHALESFAASVRHETNVDRLTDELIRIVEETIQPVGVILWIHPKNKPERRPGVIPDSPKAL